MQVYSRSESPFTMPTPKVRRVATLHRNRALNSLEPDVMSRLGHHLERVSIRRNDVLYDDAIADRFVYFPETCVLSLVSTDDNGATLAVGTFGADSMIVLPFALSRFGGSLHMVAHIPGFVHRMDTGTFNAIAETEPSLRNLVLESAQISALQIAQVATCSALHHVQERCIRALLMIHDRLSGDAFELTHDALASIVGARRAGVTGVFQALKSSGFIAYRRGNIQIIDRAGLESAACSCVHILQRLVPPCRVI